MLRKVVSFKFLFIFISLFIIGFIIGYIHSVSTSTQPETNLMQTTENLP